MASSIPQAHPLTHCNTFARIATGFMSRPVCGKAGYTLVQLLQMSNQVLDAMQRLQGTGNQSRGDVIISKG